jgi:hypothetical protein
LEAPLAGGLLLYGALQSPVVKLDKAAYLRVRDEGPKQQPPGMKGAQVLTAQLVKAGSSKHLLGCVGLRRPQTALLPVSARHFGVQNWTQKGSRKWRNFHGRPMVAGFSRSTSRVETVARIVSGAIPPPRGRPGEGPMDSPFCVEYLDAERMLPVLLRKAA